MEKKKAVVAVYNKIENDARVIRTSEALGSNGYDVTVLSFGSNPDYRNACFKSVVVKGGSSGGLNLFRFYAACLRYIFAERKRIDLLYMNDYFLVLLGAVCKALFGIKWIYDGHELILSHREKRKNRRLAFFRWIERRFDRYADYMIEANRERMRIIRHVDRIKNIDYVSNSKKRESIARPEKEDVIVYQGYLGGGRDLSRIIRAMKHLENKARFEIIGWGPDKEKYLSLCRELDLAGSVEFRDKMDYSELANETKKAKIGIMIYEMRGLNNIYCAPNKIFEYADLSIKVLSSPQPWVKKVLKEYDLGLPIGENDTPRTIAEKIDSLLNSFDYNEANIERFFRDYSYEDDQRKIVRIADLVTG